MLAGEVTVDQTIEKVQSRTRQFAKRQATWFRGLREVRSVAVPPEESAEACAERLERLFEAKRTPTNNN